MKQLFILFAVTVIAAEAMAQDVIYRTNYDTVNAKVLTVNDEEVNYKLAHYSEGPVIGLPLNF